MTVMNDPRFTSVKLFVFLSFFSGKSSLNIKTISFLYKYFFPIYPSPFYFVSHTDIILVQSNFSDLSLWLLHLKSCLESPSHAYIYIYPFSLLFFVSSEFYF